LLGRAGRKRENEQVMPSINTKKERYAIAIIVPTIAMGRPGLIFKFSF
jgi:hypothetical protein